MKHMPSGINYHFTFHIISRKFCSPFPLIVCLRLAWTMPKTTAAKVFLFWSWPLSRLLNVALARPRTKKVSISPFPLTRTSPRRSRMNPFDCKICQKGNQLINFSRILIKKRKLRNFLDVFHKSSGPLRLPLPSWLGSNPTRQSSPFLMPHSLCCPKHQS